MKKEELIAELATVQDRLQAFKKQYDARATDLFNILGLSERSRWNYQGSNSVSDPTWADIFTRIGVLQERSKRLSELENNQRLVRENEELLERLNNNQ